MQEFRTLREELPEIIAEAKKKREYRKKNGWGKWKYDNKTIVLYREDPYYEIDLETIKNEHDIVHWLSHISEKTWESSTDQGDLFEALNELAFDLRNYHGNKIDYKTTAREWFSKEAYPRW